MIPFHPTPGGRIPHDASIDADLLKRLLDCIHDGVCLLDSNSRVLYWNSGAEQITGYLAQEVTGRLCSEDLELCHDCEGENLVDGICPMSLVKGDAKPRECLIQIRHKQGHRVPVRMRAQAIHDARGAVIGLAEIFAQASAVGRTELAEAARHLGHDTETGAQTREYGEMRLNHELEAMKRFGLELAWMRIDLRDAEDLRHRFGPGMVEAATRMIAHTIDANLRGYDALVRWDRSSFRVMVRHARDERVKELAERLERMVETSEVPWWGLGRTVRVSVSAAMAVKDDTAASLEWRVAGT